MRKAIVWVVVSMLCMVANAQDSLRAAVEPWRQIEFSVLGYLNSNTINDDFVKAFYRGEYLNEDLKTRAMERMKAINRLGGMARVGFTYSFQMRQRPGLPIFSLSVFDRSHLDLKFSDDLFRLIFFGNKQFEGSTADLSGFHYEFLRYQQFRFGWHWKGDDYHGSYGAAISLLSGEQNTWMHVPYAALSTAGNGESLDLNVYMNVYQSDPSARKFFSQQGSGLSADLFYEMPYTFWKHKGRIRAEIKDLGYIHWNGRSRHISADSVYHYDGVSVDDLFNLDSLGTFDAGDVIAENTRKTVRPFAAPIPGMLDVQTRAFYGKQMIFEKGITWRFNTSARMYYYAKFHFLFGRKRTTDLAWVIGYGGYGGFNSGADVRFDFAKHYHFHLMSYYLFSGATAQSSTGMGFFASIARTF